MTTTEQTDLFDFIDEIADEEPISETELEVSQLAAEPLFAVMMRQAIQKTWGDDPVMADFVNHVVQPLSDGLGHESAKGGDFAADHLAQGKDVARYQHDQSQRAHLNNGLLPTLHVGKHLKQWDAPQFRFYDDEVRRVFIAGYILHDWLKLPQVEAQLEAAGFNHADSIGLAQMPLVETIFKEWGATLGLTQFLAPIGGIDHFIQDLIFIACNTQRKWGTLRNLSLLPRLKLDANKRGLCEQLSRLADYLTYIARTPPAVATHAAIRREISTLSNRMAVFSYHHMADNRGLSTNFIQNSVLDALRHEARVPLLYAPSGVVYLTRKDAPPPPSMEDLIKGVVDNIKSKVAQRLDEKGFKRDGKGLKFADYYWLFFTTPDLIQLAQKATANLIHEKKKAAAGKRFTKMIEGAWLAEDVDLELADDQRVDQLAEWAYLAEKLTKEHAKDFDMAEFLLTEMGLADLKTTFELVPRDNRAGGVGYHWYFIAGHYLKRHQGLYATAWQERIAQFAQKLAQALPVMKVVEHAQWQDLRDYVATILTIGESPSPSTPHEAALIELNRYQNAKRKGKGKTAICAMCSASYQIGKQQEAAVLFAPQVYSNKLSLHGSDALRNICTICSLETMLRQLFMNHTSASGGDFEGRRTRYLFFYPTYFFTPETLLVINAVRTRLKRVSFTELKKVLLHGEGLDTTLQVDPQTLQRLENLVLLDPNDAALGRDPLMRFAETEPLTFTFLGIPPASREAKDAESWVHPAFLALLLPLCLDVKVIATESSDSLLSPIVLEADELPETVFMDGAHAFVGHLLQRERINIDQLLPALQRLIVAYLIHLDANSGMGRGGFDYRWQDIAAIGRNLAVSPLYAFHYLKKWQRKQKLDSLPIGKAKIYIDYAENYLAKGSDWMTHAKQLTELFRQFYRARNSKASSILYPLRLATDTLIKADPRLFDSPAALTEVVYGEVRHRVTKLQQDGLARYPKGSNWEEREQAMFQFANYLVNTIYVQVFQQDVSAMRGKQINLISNTCEAIYRKAEAEEYKARGENVEEVFEETDSDN